jgi:hypothetical protein
MEDRVVAGAAGHRLNVEALELHLQWLDLAKVAGNVLVQKDGGEPGRIEPAEPTVAVDPVAEALEKVERRSMHGRDPVFARKTVQCRRLEAERGPLRDDDGDVDVCRVEGHVGSRRRVGNDGSRAGCQIQGCRHTLHLFQVGDVDPEEAAVIELGDVDGFK